MPPTTGAKKLATPKIHRIYVNFWGKNMDLRTFLGQPILHRSQSPKAMAVDQVGLKAASWFRFCYVTNKGVVQKMPDHFHSKTNIRNV